MSQKRTKLVVIRKDTHDKLKFYSQLVGVNISKIADEAINEYIENHPINDRQKKEWVQKLIKTV